MKKIPIDYDLDNTWHVYPVREEKIHSLEGLDCPCNPKIEKQFNGGMLVIHNKYEEKV